MPSHHRAERHAVERTGWLRAAVLGANDGIVSTVSLILGVATGGGGRAAILVAGTAGVVAGAMSMAAGEYVSVSSQADIERAELVRERRELATDWPAERKELADIYTSRGLDPSLSTQVADQLMAKDALGAHSRDELGISDTMAARPLQAAFASAASFTVGAALPLALAAVLPAERLILGESAASLLFLAVLGIVGAYAGGAPIFRAAVRVTMWGGLAMAVTAGIGRLVGHAV